MVLMRLGLRYFEPQRTQANLSKPKRTFTNPTKNMNTLDTGRQGEDVAAEFLQQNGYRIQARNFRAGHSEVDLIAWSPGGQALVFVEVKTRALDQFGGPEEAVNRKKQDQIARAAGAYMESIGYEAEIRFDIVAVLLRAGRVMQIRHAEDAFFPM
jgi:putative endonuclease